MGTTPIYGFPYPDPSDLVANYPALGQELAEDIEAVLPTVGGVTLITTGTLSGSTTSVNDCFTTDFDNYWIVMRHLTVSTANLLYRMRLAGTDNTSTNYAHQFLNAGSTTVTAGRGTSQTSALFSNGNAGAEGWVNLYLYRPALAEPTSGQSQNGNTVTGCGITHYAQGHNVSTAYDGITFLTSTGNFSGNFFIYGLRD